MSVSQFNAAVKRMVQGQIPALWLRGEVVGLKPHPKGHWYFSLRDGGGPGPLRHVAHLHPAGREAPEGRHRGLRPRPGRFLRGQGRVPAQHHPHAAHRRRRRGPAGARAGQGGAAARRTLRSRPQAAAAGAGLHRRRGHQPRRRGAARHRDRGEEAVALLPAPGGGRPGPGRGRGRGAGRGAPTGQPAERRRPLHRGARRRRRGRTWRPSTPRRSAAPSPRCACPPSRRWATRPTSPSPTSSPTTARPRPRPRRRRRSRIGSRCAASWTISPRGWRAVSAAAPVWPPSGWAAPRTGCTRRWRTRCGATAPAWSGSPRSSTR